MGKQVVDKDLNVTSIINDTNFWVSDIIKNCNEQIKSVLDKQGMFIDGYNKVLNQITKYNDNPNASFLIKGESPVYIAPFGDVANKRQMSLEFNKNRKSSPSDSIPLILNAGLSVVFKDINPDEFYIIIKDELCYDGDYYADTPAEKIEYKEPQNVPILNLLNKLCLYIDNYSSGANQFDAILNGIGVGLSLNLDISLYLQVVLMDYDMDLISIAGSVSKKELYLKLTNPDYEHILDLFKVSKENYFNDFNTVLYNGFE